MKTLLIIMYIVYGGDGVAVTTERFHVPSMEACVQVRDAMTGTHTAKVEDGRRKVVVWIKGQCIGPRS